MNSTLFLYWEAWRKKMRRLMLFLGVLLLASLLASCSENPGTTTMKLVLSTDQNSGGRTLLPEDSSVLDVTKYSVSGTGPHGGKFTKNSDVSSVEVEGLATGSWTVIAKGLNRDGTELITGSATFELSSSSDPVTIVMDTLVGTGSFKMVLDWSLCDVAKPSVVVYLSGSEADSQETTIPATLNKDSMTATVSESLASGSYRIRAVLMDGQQQVAGLVEALRISNGSRTSGSYTFHLDSEGPSSLTYMNDASGAPLRGSLSVTNDNGLFYDGVSYSCAFSFAEPSEVDVREMKIEWYYDGILVKSQDMEKGGSTYDIDARIGAHRLDAVVYNKIAGSTGSASYTFNVVPNGVTGEMILLNPDAAQDIGTIDFKTIISPLPGNMYLVVTPNSAKAYICTVSSMCLQVVKTYDANNFEWLGRTKKVFSHPDSCYVIFSDDLGDTNNFTILRFNQGSRVLENIAGKRFQYKIQDRIPIGGLNAAAFNWKGYIYLTDANTVGVNFGLKEVNNSPEIVSYYSIGKDNTNACDIDVSPDGNRVVHTGQWGNWFISNLVNTEGTVYYPTMTEESTAPPRWVRFLNNQTVAAVDEANITTFKTTSDGVYSRYKSFSIETVDIAQDGGNYFYIADSSKNLVSFSVSGYEIAQIGQTALESQISRICLNGQYLAALTEDDHIALFKVIE